MTLSATGFLAKRLPQIKAELEAEFTAQFGADLNLSAETVFGQLIGIESEATAEYWATLDDVYQSQYPATANGVSLDLLCALTGISRLGALPTTVAGYMAMTPGTVVPAGSRAKDGEQTYSLTGSVTASAGATYGVTVSVPAPQPSTVYSVTIDGTVYSVTSDTSPTASEILTALSTAVAVDHTVELSAQSLHVIYGGPLSVSVSASLSLVSVDAVGTYQCDTDGPVALPIGALSEIETPVAGWQSVTNRAAGTLGRYTETDAELRVRRDESVRLQAVSTVDGITAQLKQVDDVLDAIVIENSTETTSVDGIPPHFIWCIVDGGSDADIADVIYRRKAGGIGTFGDETQLAFSGVTGDAYEIRFGRPVNTPVYITVNIDGSAALPSDYIALVRAALVAHGDQYLGIGDDLIVNRLVTPASLAVDADSFVDSITVGLDPLPTTTANMIAATNERFQILAENIVVLLV